MVPTAPPAHAGEAQVEYHWLGKLARWLELGREKVAILIEEASPGGLRPLVSMLLEREPPVVCFHVTELLDVPAGSLVVLTLHEAELNWINLNRPIIAIKRLRLVLWLEFPLHRLKAKAPDFFDWISHVVRCPRLPPRFTVRRLQAAKAAQRPVAWRGKELDAALDRLGAGLLRVEARGTFAQLVSRVERVVDRVPVWTSVHDVRQLLRVELVMQRTGHPWWILEHPLAADLRYALVDDVTSSWEAATERLGPMGAVADRSAAACVAALLEADPQAVEMVAREHADGRSFDELVARLRSAHGQSLRFHEDPRAVGNDSIPCTLAPTFIELLRRHARALELDRTGAWVAAADCARAAGHADIARDFGDRALVGAKNDRQRLRAMLALAAADREDGAYGAAHARFYDLVEALDAAPEHDPRLAVVLSEQGALLAHEEQHAAAAADLEQSMEILGARPWAALRHVHLEALRLQARCLAARGTLRSEWLTRRASRWPPGEDGAILLELERARGGDRLALDRLARTLRHPPSWVCVEALGLDLAVLQLEHDDPVAAVVSCLGVLRALRARHGTDLHPRGIDARLLIGKALRERAPERARRFLRRALADCEVIHGETAHRRTLQAVTYLAEAERRRGALGEATTLAARAGAIQDAIESSIESALPEPSPDPVNETPVRSTQGVESLVADLAVLDDGLVTGADLDLLRSDVQARRMFLAREIPRWRRYFASQGHQGAEVDELVRSAAESFWERVQDHGDPASAWVPLRESDTPTPSRTTDVEAMLLRLPSALRTIVELRYMDGKPIRAIADQLGAHEATIRARLFRALTQLRIQSRRR